FYHGVFYPIWADNSNSTKNNPDGTLKNFDIYTAKLTLESLPTVTSLTIDPSPDIAGVQVTLAGQFLDPTGLGHTVTIFWGDGTSNSVITMPGVTAGQTLS